MGNEKIYIKWYEFVPIRKKDRKQKIQPKSSQGQLFGKDPPNYILLSWKIKIIRRFYM